VAVLGVMTLAAAGCGGSSSGTGSVSTTAAPPTAPEGAPPGTPLGDGFAVVPGTALVGDPIPIGVSVYVSGEPVIDEGWVATSTIEGGDPLDIIDAYLAQAEQAGLTERGRSCALEQGVAECTGSARSPDRVEPRSMSVTVVRGRSEDVVSDHVVVRYSTAEVFWQFDAGQHGGGPVIEFPDPPDRLPLPDVGESIGTGGETSRSVLVQEGSRLAGPPRRNLDDVTGGIAAILEVTGDPREVLQAYLDHLVDLGLEANTPEVLHIGEAVVTVAYAGESGGDGFGLTLVERPTRPTWLAIEGSHD
jgi:hypothetical protein